MALEEFRENNEEIRQWTRVRPIIYRNFSQENEKSLWIVEQTGKIVREEGFLPSLIEEGNFSMLEYDNELFRFRRQL